MSSPDWAGLGALLVAISGFVALFFDRRKRMADAEATFSEAENTDANTAKVLGEAWSALLHVQQEQIDQQSRRISQMECDLAGRDERLARLQKDFDDASVARRDLESQLIRLQEQFNETESGRKTRIETIAQLQAELVAIRIELAEKIGNLNVQGRRIIELEDEVAILQRQVQELGGLPRTRNTRRGDNDATGN